MSKSYKVAVVVGSLRQASVNRKAAEAVTRLAPDNLAFEFVEVGDLPLYDEDVEAAGAPAPWTRFREQISAADAVLFVTPEYNRSVPGALKNAIDVGFGVHAEQLIARCRPHGHAAAARRQPVTL